MNRVEFPQLWNLMIPTMGPVSNEIEENESHQRLYAGWDHVHETEVTDDEPKSPSE